MDSEKKKKGFLVLEEKITKKLFRFLLGKRASIKAVLPRPVRPF